MIVTRYLDPEPHTADLGPPWWAGDLFQAVVRLGGEAPSLALDGPLLAALVAGGRAIPSKPRHEVVADLRRALQVAWQASSAGDVAGAYAHLEERVIFATADLASFDIGRLGPHPGRAPGGAAQVT